MSETPGFLLEGKNFWPAGVAKSGSNYTDGSI